MLAVFDFEQSAIRVVIVDDEPWWIAIDICRVLGLSNVSKALERLDSDEKRDDLTISNAINKLQSVWAINESGLFSLVLTSRKPEAKRFKKWVTSEVLPSIRKTGSYAIGSNPSADAIFAAQSIDLIFQNVPIQPEFVASLKLNAIQQIAPHQAAILEPIRQQLIISTATPNALLTPTQIGERLGISAIKVNKLLIDAGLQTKNEQKKSRKDLDYIVTDRGREFASVTTATGKNGDNTMYQQLRWYESVVDVIRTE